MAERIQEEEEGSQTTGKTETNVSPEVQRARELQTAARIARSSLAVELAKTNKKDSEYYRRADEAGKEAYRQIDWHMHRILQLDTEMKLTEQVASYILTGESSLEARPEDIENKLAESRKNRGLDV